MFCIRKTADGGLLYSQKTEVSYHLNNQLFHLLRVIYHRLKSKPTITLDEIIAELQDTTPDQFIQNLRTLIKMQVVNVNADLHVVGVNILNPNMFDHHREHILQHNVTQNDLYLDWPVVAYWIFTNACNMRCPHCCWENHYKLEDELNEEMILKIVEELANHGLFKLSFSGGEPLIRYDTLLKALRLAKSKGIGSMCIATNGLLLTEDRVAELLDAGLTEIQVSLDSHIEEVHDRGRGQGNFRQTVTNLKRLTEKFGSKHLVIGTTLTTQNVDHIGELIDFAADEIGAEKIKVVRYTPVVKGTDPFTLSDPKQIMEISRFLVEKKLALQKRGIFLKLTGAFSILGNPEAIKQSKAACEAARVRVCILPNGMVSPCPILSSHKVVLGSLKEQSFEEIWYGDKITKFRALSKKENEECNQCEFFARCGGGCKAGALPFGGKMTSPDPWCLKKFTQGD